MTLDNGVQKRIELDKIPREQRLGIIRERVNDDLKSLQGLSDGLCNAVNQTKRTFWISTALVIVLMAWASIAFSADAGFIIVVAMSFLIMRITTYNTIVALDAMASCIQALYYHQANTTALLFMVIDLTDAGDITPAALLRDKEQREG